MAEKRTTRAPRAPKTNLQVFHDKIKQKLHDWQTELRVEHGLEIDFTALAKVINQRYRIDTSAKILASMFSPPDAPDGGDSRKIPLAEMLAVCQELKLPIRDYCVLPSVVAEDTTDDSFVPWLKKTEKDSAETEGVRSMLDPHYFGTYYVYRFQTKQRTPLELEGKNPADGLPLKEYVLTIAEEHGVSYATMSSTEEKDTVSLRGRVFLLTRSRQVYARLVDQDGLRVINLQFSYKKYSTDKLMYRTAASLCTTYNQLEAPLFAKLAMFRERQDLSDPEVENIIRGILTLDNRDILVDERAFARLIAQDENYAKLEPKSKSYYVFQESDFANPNLPWDFETRIQRLLQLRRVSELAAHEIVEDSDHMAYFFKQLQEKHD